MMARNKSFKVGYVRVRPRGKSRWQADWRDPETGRRCRVTIQAPSEKEARERARHIDREVAAGRGVLTAHRQFNPSVADAMTEAIDASHGNLATRRDYTFLANVFVAWLRSSRLAIEAWADVTTKAIQDYVTYCQRELRLSNDGVRKRLYVVKMTSRHMADTYDGQFQDVGRRVRFVRERENPLERREKEARKVLSSRDLWAFLTHLERRRPDLHAIACLQALAGLRAMEAAHIREQDVDFTAGTATVTDTNHHRPKNQASYRTIPVAPRVLQVLRGTIDGLKVRREDGYLFATKRSNRPWSISGYHHAMRREMLACWRDDGIEALRDFQPHWLRATFVSHVRGQMVDARTLQFYVGHAPSDTLGRHYEIVDLSQFRAEILPAIEQICHDSGTGKIAEP